MNNTRAAGGRGEAARTTSIDGEAVRTTAPVLAVVDGLAGVKHNCRGENCGEANAETGSLIGLILTGTGTAELLQGDCGRLAAWPTTGADVASGAVLTLVITAEVLGEPGLLGPGDTRRVTRLPEAMGAPAGMVQPLGCLTKAAQWTSLGPASALARTAYTAGGGGIRAVGASLGPDSALERTA